MPSEAMPLGVVVERREIDNPWQDHSWCVVAVIPGAPGIGEWQRLASGPGWQRYHAATLTLELHRRETAAYRTNLSNDQPVVYVGLREVADSTEVDFDLAPFLVTASPYEAQDYLDSSEVIFEGVPMPESVIAWVQAFVDAYHVDEPFEKRKRKRFDPNQVGFGRRPGDVANSAGRGGNGDD
jgi:hypothetical protein